MGHTMCSVSGTKPNIQVLSWEPDGKTYVHPWLYYIHTWSELLAPLVNMIKEGCENLSALLILLIFYLKNWQKSNLSLENKNLKWGGKYHYEINVFL